MSKLYEYIQNEMDAIIVKTLGHVQPVIEEQGTEQARELIILIANGIKKQLKQKDMSDTDIEKIYELFLSEINAAIFEKRH